MFLYFSYYLLILTSLTDKWITLADSLKNKKYGHEFLLCRKCGADVVDSYYIFNKSSPGAKQLDKQNIYGKQNITVQTLVNPFGIKFEVVTTEKANCDDFGRAQGADSWFPGYTWRICACPRCGQHLGWTFENTKATSTDSEEHVKKFHGIITSNILGENFTDSLIMLPKMYTM